MEQQPDQPDNFRPDVLIIPGIVAFDSRLQPLDLKVYAIVFWLEKLKDGRCFASNAYIAKLVDSSSGGVSNSISRLDKAGYVQVIIDKDKQRTEVKTMVSMSVNPTSNDGGGVNQMMDIRNKRRERTYKSETREQAEELHRGYVWLFRINRSDKATGSRPDLINEALKRYKLTPKRMAVVAARLEDAGFDMCKQAIKNAANHPFNLGENDRGWTADLYEYLFRNYEMVEKWATKED